MGRDRLCLDLARESLYIEIVKKALAFFFVLALASIASAQNWFRSTLDEAVAKAKIDNKLVLLDFYSYT